MSRSSIYRKRRCFLLWAPLAALGSAIYIYSLGLTLTANGLTVFGLLVLATGGVMALKESSR